MSATKIETPTLDAMNAVKIQSQEIGNFIEWLSEEKRIHLAKIHHHKDDCWNETQAFRLCGFRDGELVGFPYTTERLLAEYFEIDLKEAEREKLKLLESISST